MAKGRARSKRHRRSVDVPVALAVLPTVLKDETVDVFLVLSTFP